LDDALFDLLVAKTFDVSVICHVFLAPYS
jgi:hypothetical protein